VVRRVVPLPRSIAGTKEFFWVGGLADRPYPGHFMWVFRQEDKLAFGRPSGITRHNASRYAAVMRFVCFEAVASGNLIHKLLVTIPRSNESFFPYPRCYSSIRWLGVDIFG